MSPLRRVFFMLLLLVLTGPAAVEAQEVQVPLDLDGRLDEIDRGLASRLGLLLDEYPDLEVARLYRVDEERYVLEVTYRADGRLARQRMDLTAAEVRDLRTRVSAALAELAPEVTLDQDGRFLLLGTTTYLGLSFYGWAVPAVLDIDSGRGVLASYMFTAGASFIVPYLYTRTRPVTYGMANAGFWGATRGILHGLYLGEILHQDGSRDEFGNDSGERLLLGLGLAMSLGEGLAGYQWGKSADLTAGQAHTIGNYGDYGHAGAAATMLILDPNDEKVVLGALLAGSGLGLAWGAHRYPSLPYSWGDAEVQRIGVFLGALNGAMAWDWMFGGEASDDQARILGAMMLGGSAATMTLVNRALVGKEFSAGQSILIDLGTIAGGLVGLGAAALAQGTEGDGTLFLSLMTAGADIGFLLTFNSLADDAARRGERQRGRLGHLDGLDLDFNPAALLMLRPEHADRLPAGFGVPLLSASYRF